MLGRYVYLSTYQRPAGEGSNKETSVSPGVPDKSIVVLATSSKGTSTKPGVLDEEKVTSKANVILEWGSEQEGEYSEEEHDDDDEMIEWVDMDEEEEKKDDDDDKSIDLEQIGDEETDDEFVHGEEHVQDDDEETDDEFVHGDEYVNEDEDEEMTNAEVEESGNGDEEVSDATKVDAGKTEEVKDDSKKAKLPSTSSNLLVSSGFGDQFLKLLSDTSLISNVKDTTDAEINSLLDIKIQYEVPYIQSPFVLTVPILVIFEPSVLTPIPETSSVAPTTNLLPPSSVSTIPHVLLQTITPIPTPPITTEAPTITTAIPESNALVVVQLRVAKLAKGMSELKKMDHSAEALATLKSQVPTILPSQARFRHQQAEKQESKKSALEIHKIKKEQAKKQKMPKYIIKSTDKATLKEYDLKKALYQTMKENKSFNKNTANHALYHALMEALIEDGNTMDKGGKKTKRRRTKESESFMKPSTTKETSKGKVPTKSSKTGKSATAQEPIEEPIAEVVMDDQETTEYEDVVNDANRPQDNVAPKINKDTWFKQPPRPSTPDPE
ncbi:hypothetical protein Tco_0102715 [Tanacetum coccineum]